MRSGSRLQTGGEGCLQRSRICFMNHELLSITSFKIKYFVSGQLNSSKPRRASVSEKSEKHAKESWIFF